jgi:hypothetical protein
MKGRVVKKSRSHYDHQWMGRMTARRWGIVEAFAVLAVAVGTFVCTMGPPRTSGAKLPRTLSGLLALGPDQLEGADIAMMNLLCAEGLPGAEDLRVEECLSTLNQWAQHARREIEHNRHHFREDPAYYYHSEAFYQMLMLAVVVYEDFGVRYNPKWISAPSEVYKDDHFFADSRDILIHGMLGPGRMGTCSSMPVLYIALGRRLGYPLKLVSTRQHLFMRWDGSEERFDMEATGKGLDRYDDEHYRKWPFPINEQEIKEQGYLTSLSPREELSVFLSIRGTCLVEAGRSAEALASFDAAYRCAPNWKGNQLMLAEARRQQPGLRTARPVMLRQAMNWKGPTNGSEPDPLGQLQNPVGRAQTPNPIFLPWWESPSRSSTIQ